MAIVESEAGVATVDAPHAVIEKPRKLTTPTERPEGTTTVVGATHAPDRDLLTVTDTIDRADGAEMKMNVHETEVPVETGTVEEGEPRVPSPSLPRRNRQKMNAIGGRFSSSSSRPG